MSDRSRGYAHRIDILAPAPRVWKALVDPTLLSLWHSPGAKVRPRTGGSYVVTPEPGLVREAHIDIYEPPRRLRLIYMPPPGLPELEGVMVDDLLLEHGSGATIVRLLGSGIPPGKPWDGYYLKLRVGWERALARLKVMMEFERKGGRPG